MNERTADFPSSRWSPDQYLRFAGPRKQPALDLLARIPLTHADFVVDLGCGTGEMVGRLADRYPNARVVGVDHSEEMIARARAERPGQEWLRADAATYEPGQPLDVLYSNAVFHWLPDHGALFPHLLDHLRPGGVFAVQVPANQDAPSHRLLRECLAGEHSGGRTFGTEELRAQTHHTNVREPEFYDRLLRGRARQVEVWCTEYLHRLTGTDPVLEWVRGTTLRPVLEALEGEELEAFLELYATKLREAYPADEDGSTLFRFRRNFVLAVR